jgi:hypothetical protein
MKYNFILPLIIALTIAMPTSKLMGSEKEVGLEFETSYGIRRMNVNTIIPGPYYYSNASDDPSLIPKTGEVDGVKFIEISSIKGNSRTTSSTQAYLNRWVEIPKPAPPFINVSFKTKVSKNDDYDWAMPGEQGVVKRKLNANVVFMREDGLRGGGFRLTSRPLTKELDTWLSHSYTIPIPKEAKYLQLFLLTSGGFDLAIGNWKISKATPEQIKKTQESLKSKSGIARITPNPITQEGGKEGEEEEEEEEEDDEN